MITAKELAKILGLSEAAVSMALNGKAGVSEKTRERVVSEARRQGYDFSRIREKSYDMKHLNGTVCFVLFQKHGAVVADTPFFSQLTQGIENACRGYGYNLAVRYVDGERADEDFREIARAGYGGAVVLGTEMDGHDFTFLETLSLPLVLLDSYSERAACDCVLINNRQGAFNAASYLISKYKSQAGYLHSGYPIHNFSERADGFYKAIREHGMSPSRCVRHELTPSLEGAYADMKNILSSGEKLARCYFADNDLIAAGAMRALSEAGHKIPQDVAVFGFDDMPLCTYTTPSLSTVGVPKQFMGKIAAERILARMNAPEADTTTTEVNTKLIRRGSA